MSNAENGILYYEAGQTVQAYTLLTDQGDHKDFRSAVDFWSGVSGYEPVVRPNGIASGPNVCVIPAVSGSNDVVDTLALTAYLIGVSTSVIATTDTAVTRGAAADICKISSITVNAAGSIAVVAGTAHTAFSETRAALGGPPLIPVGSIEIAQVRLGSTVAAPIDADEIFVVPGTHQEWYNYPVWTVEHFQVTNGIMGNAGVEFAAALPLIHTGVLAKRVYAQYYTPTFAEITDAYDFSPPADSHSVASKQVYGRTKGSVASSIGQGSFSVDLDDGISDGFLGQKNKNLLFKFLQDRLKTPYVVCQGKLGVTRTFPAGDSITASCTISASVTAEDVVG